MTAVNNDFYHDLGDAWWTATDHMVTFLRDESVIKLDYIRRHLPADVEGEGPLRILDLGAGAGLISIPLAMQGHAVTALDLSASSLAVLERQADRMGCRERIIPVQASMLEPLPLNQKFDVVLAMDVLEHVPRPDVALRHASRCLKPGGWFIYHTLNRTLHCWLMYLQLAPRLIRHSPKDVHRHEFNIKPQWMQGWLTELGFRNQEQVGIRTPFFQKATWDLLTTRALHSRMRFEYTRDLSLGYLGRAQLMASVAVEPPSPLREVLTPG